MWGHYSTYRYISSTFVSHHSCQIGIATNVPLRIAEELPAPEPELPQVQTGLILLGRAWSWTLSICLELSTPKNN